MTIDNLALAVQKDFNDVRAEMAEIKREMATKVELRAMEDRLFEAINGLRKFTEGLGMRLDAYASRTNEDIAKLQNSAKDFDVRLRVVEKRG